MRYIEVLKEGDKISDIYLCKQRQSLTTKNGKPYESVILQDKTGTVDAKIWEPNSQGIDDFDNLDYIEVYRRTEYITKTITPRRWGIGVIAGYGIGKHGLSPYVGLGGFCRIW